MYARACDHFFLVQINWVLVAKINLTLDEPCKVGLMLLCVGPLEHQFIWRQGVLTSLSMHKWFKSYKADEDDKIIGTGYRACIPDERQ